MTMPWLLSSPEVGASHQVVINGDDDEDDEREESFIVLDPSPSLLESETQHSVTTEEIAEIQAENETLKENMMKNTELLRRQLLIMQSWKEEKEKMMNTYHKSLDDLRLACEQYREKNEGLAREVLEYQTKLQACQAKVAEMEAARAADLRNTEEEKNQLRAQIGQAELRIQEAFTRMEEERLALKNEIEQADKKSQDSCRELEELRVETERQQLQLKLEVNTLEAEKSQLRSSLDQAESKLRECLMVEEGAESFTVVHRLSNPNVESTSATKEMSLNTSSSDRKATAGDKALNKALKSFCKELRYLEKSQQHKKDSAGPSSAVEVVAASEDVTKLQEEVRTLHNLLALERAKREEDRRASVEAMVSSEDLGLLREEVRTLHNLLTLERDKREEESHQLEESRTELQRLQLAHNELKQILGPVETEAECLVQQSEAMDSIVSRKYQEQVDQLTARCLHAEQLLESQRDPESQPEDLERQLSELRDQIRELNSQLEQERSKRETAEKDNQDLQEVISTIFEESSSAANTQSAH